MKKIKFNNEEIKEYYNSLIKRYQVIDGIISSILRDNNNLLIDNITNDSYNTDFMVITDDNKIIISIDLLKNCIYVDNPNKPYREIYSNYVRTRLAPNGYEYKNKDKVLIKRVLSYESHNEKKAYYDIYNDNSVYSMIVETNNEFNEQEFIDSIISEKNTYKSIRDLVIILLNLYIINNITVKLTDTKGSIVIIENGVIKKYLEYREKDTEYQKIYLENNEFYVEKKVKEVYQDDMTNYVKKIGERNGKEKREN